MVAGEGMAECTNLTQIFSDIDNAHASPSSFLLTFPRLNSCGPPPPHDPRPEPPLFFAGALFAGAFFAGAAAFFEKKFVTFITAILGGLLPAFLSF